MKAHVATMIALIRRHPLASYFTLAFTLSWAGVLAVVLPGPIPAPPAEAQRLFTFVYLAMLVGPPAAGIAMTWVVSGRDGLLEYRRRLFHWNVSPSWYAIALLTAPVTLVATLWILSLFSSDFTFAFATNSSSGGGPPGVIQSASRSSFVLTSVLVGMGAGFFEELGWTGFATPTMRRRYLPMTTAILIGFFWGAWHFLAVLWGSASAFGSVPIPVFMTVGMFSFLPPYRALMVWVYDHTHSLLIGILMHASLTTSMLMLGPGVSGWAGVAYNLVFAGVVWTIVGIVHTKAEARSLSDRERHAAARILNSMR